MVNVFVRKKIPLILQTFSAILIVTLICKLPFFANCVCPPETDLLRRLGNTRFYIIQGNERGNFVSFYEAADECAVFGLKMAKIENMGTMAVVGRELEKLVDRYQLKDTWYWLDAKFNATRDVYEWGQHGKDGDVKYSNFLYRPPRPTGVAGFVDYMGEYHRNNDVEQCLTLALPWPGKVDFEELGVIFGHQTILDERACESVQKRHVMCESIDPECNPIVDDPFILTESNLDYFENGNWIFGDRRYLVNWKHRTVNESKAYCQNLGLELFKPELDEPGLIAYLKMWSREVTTSQFWTSYTYNTIDKKFMTPGNEYIHGTRSEWRFNFHEPILQARSMTLDTDFCVAMALSYEFKGQLPCVDKSNPNCTWSFVDYVPANCNNYLATICQHGDKEGVRNSHWNSDFIRNVDVGLKETALTKEFGWDGNDRVLRSKYKQTFGILYCPKGYRMLRAKNRNWFNLLVHLSAHNYSYDYKETYWVVDSDLFNKNNDSNCTISEPDPIGGDGHSRTERKVKCTEWHFYACEKLSNATKIYADIRPPIPPKMIWKEGPQRRIYPLMNDFIEGRKDEELVQVNHNASQVSLNDRFTLKIVNGTKKAFLMWKF